MSFYECTFICTPEIPPEKVDEAVEKVTKIVQENNGSIIIANKLGRRRLAYPIKKFREGSYVYMELSGTGEMVSAIENYFKISDFVIRYLTVKAAKKPVAPKSEELPQTNPEEGKSNEQHQHTASRTE